MLQAESVERKRKAAHPPIPAPAANAKRKKAGKFNKATSQLISKWQSVRQDLVSRAWCGSVIDLLVFM